MKDHPELVYDLLVVDEGIFDDCLAYGMTARTDEQPPRFHSYYQIKDGHSNSEITSGYTVEEFYAEVQKAALISTTGEDERPVMTRSRPERPRLPQPGTESRPRPPAGSAVRAYKTLKGFEDAERFDLSRFKERREGDENRSFSDTTMRVELNALADLGILDVIRGRTGNLYMVDPVYGRAPPEAHARVERILAELHAEPKPRELDHARKQLVRSRHRTGIQALARTVRENSAGGKLEPVIANLLLYWPDRAINLSEKRSVLSLLSPEEGRFFLYASGLIHHKKIRKGGRLDLGVSIRSLLGPAVVPELTADEARRRQDSLNDVDAFARVVEKARDLTGDETLLRNPEEVETTIREMASIYRSFIHMTGPARWITGRYFGFRADGLDFDTGGMKEPELVKRINDDRDAFLSTLPDDIGSRIKETLKAGYDEMSAATEKGSPGQFDPDQIRAYTFVRFLSDLWMEHALIDRFGVLDIGVFTNERGLRIDVVNRNGERAERIKAHLERAVELAEDGKFQKARTRAMKARLIHSDNPEVSAVMHYISELEELAGIFRDARALRAMEQYLIEGRSPDDIAASYGMTAADTKRSLYRSLSVFRELLPASVELDALSRGMRTVYVAHSDHCTLICDPESMARRFSDPRSVPPVPFATAVPSRITREQTIQLGLKGGHSGEKNRKVVLIERPGEGEIEVWPSDRLEERAYHYELTGDPAQAADVLLADPGRWEAPFGAERFTRSRTGEGSSGYTYYGTKGDLAILAALGALERDDSRYPRRYRLSKRSADHLFGVFLARLVYDSLLRTPVTVRIEKTLSLLKDARETGIFNAVRQTAEKGGRPGNETIEEAVRTLSDIAESHSARLNAGKARETLRDKLPDLTAAIQSDSGDNAEAGAELHDHLPVPPEGSAHNAFKSIISDLDFSARSFTRADFRAKRKRKGSRKPLSYSVITRELRVLTALGIISEEKSGSQYMYRLKDRFARAPPELLEKVLTILRGISDDPRSAAYDEGIASASAEIERNFERVTRKKLTRPQELRSHREVLLYYLKLIPQYNLRLIRLSSERAHLASMAAGTVPEKPEGVKTRSLEECQAEIDNLKQRMRMEFSLLPERSYPLSLTGGRELREQALEKLWRSLEMIEKRNEPAAGALLCASARLLAKELRSLSDTGRKERRGSLSWHDRVSNIDNVIRGQFH
ncbi:MAG: hypothetical protein GF392_05850, partial [Candidatus Omnitrophica bacterium]|nr:hypothetical protein [Candidatus Omnitrophota bacterium]